MTVLKDKRTAVMRTMAAHEEAVAIVNGLGVAVLAALKEHDEAGTAYATAVAKHSHGDPAVLRASAVAEVAPRRPHKAIPDPMTDIITERGTNPGELNVAYPRPEGGGVVSPESSTRKPVSEPSCFLIGNLCVFAVSLRAMRNQVTCVASLLAAASLVSGVATADDSVHGLRSDKVVERAHRIALRIGHEYAELIVQRTVFNGGLRHDQTTFFIDVPREAVATGLRTMGIKNGQPIWYEGELMSAEVAAAKYLELTGIGGYYPKDPALLSWRQQELLALQVFPCPPAQAKTVEYTLKMPVHYRGGRYHLELPAMGTEALRPQAVVTAMDGKDQIFVDGAQVASGTSIKLNKEKIDVAIVRPAADWIEGVLASVPVSRQKGLTHFGFQAAPRIAVAPRGAYVVVVIDASRSMSDGETSAAVAAAKATLQHLPDAHVEVLTFDRSVHSRHHGFVPVAAALADLESLVIERHNGSRLDVALEQADAMLAKAPEGAARRALLMTDLRTRSALTPERSPHLRRSGAVLHIGLISEGDPKLTPDDDNPWATVARSTKGLLWQASASSPPMDAPEMKRVYEEWARPMRLRHVELTAKGSEGEAFSLPETLEEGEGIEDLRLPYKPMTEVVLSGELWGDTKRVVLKPNANAGKLWSAMVFGSAVQPDLTDKEMMYLAMRGHAVSPMTSFLAIEPGVRPSTEGLEYLSGIGEGGGGVGEGIGLGSIGTLGHGGGARFNKDAFLRDALKQATRTCDLTDRTVMVTLETTLTELVEVPEVNVSGDLDMDVQRCVEEAVWGIDLPGAFADEFATFSVVF